jgi:membrane protein
MGLAQEVAYSSLLAFFPAVIALVGLLDLINAYGALRSFLDPVAPHAIIQLIDSFERDSGGSGSVLALVIGLTLAVWAASGAMGSVVKAVNRTYDRMETRPFWKVKLISIFLVLVSALVTAGMLLLIVLGGTLGDAISRRTNNGSFTWVWNILRWPIAFAAVLLLFALIYYLAPNTDERRWRWVSAGAVTGGLMWLALSGLFALYTSFSSSYTRTYGALATGIILLLWLNYSAWAVLFGAELNAQLDRHAEIRAAGGEHAGLIRPVRRTR